MLDQVAVVFGKCKFCSRIHCTCSPNFFVQFLYTGYVKFAIKIRVIVEFKCGGKVEITSINEEKTTEDCYVNRNEGKRDTILVKVEGNTVFFFCFLED